MIFFQPIVEALAMIGLLSIAFLIFRKYRYPGYLTANAFVKANVVFLAFAVFTIFIFAGISVMLLNQYSFMFNAGDAGDMVQVLYNAGHGHLFSQSLAYFSNGAYMADSNYFYGSSLPMNPWITPLVLFSWFYNLMPHPPMQTIILFLAVFGGGGASMYYISHKITGDKGVSAYLLVLFLFFPLLQRIVIAKGAYDVYSIPFLLWTLYFLYTKRPVFFVTFLLLSAGVGYATQFTCIAIAIVAVVMHREIKYLVISGIMIGIGALTPTLMAAARYCLAVEPAHPFTDLYHKMVVRTVSTLGFGSFSALFFFEIVNIGLTIVLINPLLIRYGFRDKWARYLLLATIPSFGITAIRGAALTSHHTADAIVIFFFVYILFLKKDCWSYISRSSFGKVASLQLLIFAITPILILFHSQALPRFQSLLMGKASDQSAFLHQEHQVEDIVHYMDSHISRSASLCLWFNYRFDGQFTSRPSVWRMLVVPNIHYSYPRCQVYLLDRNMATFLDIPPDPRAKAILESPASQGLVLEYKNDLYEIWSDASAPLLLYPEWVTGFEPFKNIFRTECPPKPTMSIIPPQFKLQTD